MKLRSHRACRLRTLATGESPRKTDFRDVRSLPLDLLMSMPSRSGCRGQDRPVQLLRLVTASKSRFCAAANPCRDRAAARDRTAQVDRCRRIEVPDDSTHPRTRSSRTSPVNRYLGRHRVWLWLQSETDR